MNESMPERLADELGLAFPEFVDTHGPLVLTLATRLTDSTTGQDITQEVFLRAYRALDGYTRNRIIALQLRPWLATITRNLVRNEYRRRERRATVPLDQSATTMVDEQDLAKRSFESHDRVNELLSPLSDSQREAVVLRHVVGLSIGEVALTMACPVGTAKAHVSRGLARLRETKPVVPEPKGDDQ